VFLVAYGAITPTFSTTYFMVFVDMLAGAASYWVVTLLVSATALIPYFTYAVIKTWFFPDYHNKIQWLRHRNRGQPDSNADVEFGQALRQFSVRSTGVGVSARRDATELVRDVEFRQALRQFSVRSTGVGVSARRDTTELVRDVEFRQALRQFSVRSTGVGVSARRDATELVHLNK
jgi:hypothetical protein